MTTKQYIFANWGETVYVTDLVGRKRKGVITEFDASDKNNTKVLYQSGGFDWYNRDEVEQSMIAREQVAIDTNENQLNNL